jgi:hypothetical protein
MKTRTKTKTKRHIYTALILFLFAVLLFACTEVKHISTTETTYTNTHKQSGNVDVSYKLPLIKPTGKTEQSQTKGGVIITAEIVPFTATVNYKRESNITYADPDQPGYDVYEVSNTPYYIVAPNNIQFRIRIRNNEQVPLKLSEVGFALIIDGVQWSFPQGYLDEWNKGLILTGFDKEYTINGPDLSGLYNAQVVYLFLNGVPTSYDDAGNIKKKDNFEWYFECKTQEVQKQEQKTYTYETSPVFKEKCAKCSGTGVDPTNYKCTYCNGAGQFKGTDGKIYKCSKCNGTGIVHYKCPDCGGTGVIALPKSSPAPVESSIRWSGEVVQVVTNPPGAKVSVVNTKTKEYQSAGMSDVTVYWYSSDQKSYPIMVEYQGKTVNVLPYSSSGKLIPKVLIDFSGGTPIVSKGKRVD